MDLEDIKDGVIIILAMVISTVVISCIIGFSSVKIQLYTTKEKIKIYQEANVIDEDTKKILIEKLDI